MCSAPTKFSWHSGPVEIYLLLLVRVRKTLPQFLSTHTVLVFLTIKISMHGSIWTVMCVTSCWPALTTYANRDRIGASGYVQVPGCCAWQCPTLERPLSSCVKEAISNNWNNEVFATILGQAGPTHNIQHFVPPPHLILQHCLGPGE